MLKIYLDQNVISKLKWKEYFELRGYLMEVKDYFIFPYSRAHLMDLYKSKDEAPQKYNEDIKTITSLCENHLLEFYSDRLTPYPSLCFPSDYIQKEKSSLELSMSGFDFKYFDLFLHNLAGAEQYSFIKSQLLSQKVDNPRCENLWSLLEYQLNNISQILLDKKFEGKLLQKIREIDGGQTIDNISKQDSSIIIPYLDSVFLKNTGKTTHDIILDGMGTLNINKFQQYFITEYIMLALTGYSRDKKRNLLNIYTDALHVSYATFCDVLVTDDVGMIKKAHTEFARRNSSTKIIGIYELKSFLEKEINCQYNINYIFDISIPTFSIPTVKPSGDWVYKNVEHPLFGIFRNCIALPNVSESVMLKVNLDPLGYTFYSEFDRFFELIRDNINEDAVEYFTSEIMKPYSLHDSAMITIPNITISLNNGWSVEIKKDPDFSTPIPMVICRKSVLPTKS